MPVTVKSDRKNFFPIESVAEETTVAAIITLQTKLVNNEAKLVDVAKKEIYTFFIKVDELPAVADRVTLNEHSLDITRLLPLVADILTALIMPFIKDAVEPAVAFKL